MAEFWPDANKTARVTIVTVDPRTRQVHAVLKDGVAIVLAVWDTPSFFRWPREGEEWTAVYESGYWRLGQHMGDDTTILDLLPGEARIDADNLFISGDTYVLGQAVVLDNDIRLTNSRTPTGPAGGVLSGTYPDPGFAVDMATQAELNAIGTDVTTHAALTTTAHGGIVASTDPRLSDPRVPTGDAGGVLDGTYPNPSFAVPMATASDLAASNATLATHTALTTAAHGGIVANTDPRLTNDRIPTGPAGGVLSGSYPNPGFALDMATQAELDATQGALTTHAALTTTAHGGIVASTDPRLSDDRIPTGTAGGVLSGTYPNPGFAADMATQAELDTHAALTTSAHGGIVADTDPRLTNDRVPTGTAGGVLSGSYPNPGFAVDMATQGELDTHTGNTSNPHSVTKTQVGLANVDNTADTAKPVSTAQQTALDLKAPLASPTFTGTVTVPGLTMPSGSVITSPGYIQIEAGAANNQIMFRSRGIEMARFNTSDHFVLNPASVIGWSAAAGTGIVETYFLRASAGVAQLVGGLVTTGALNVGTNATAKHWINESLPAGTAHSFYSIYKRVEPDDIGYALGYIDKLYIRNHTGIIYDAYQSGGGHRFYVGYNPDGTPTSKVFSIGEGDTNVRVGTNLLVGGNIEVAGYLQLSDSNYKVSAVSPGVMQYDSASDHVFRYGGAETMRIKNGTAVTAVGGAENLRILRGTVNSAGTILAGSGFSVVANGSGSYTITFSTAFSSAPSVIVTPTAAGYGHTNVPATGSVNVTTYEENPSDGFVNPTSMGFSFYAIGPRA